MYNSTILDIGVIAYFNIINIAPDNRIEPYRAIIAHHNIANYRSIFGNKAIGTPT
jgi:hypothetical protein